MWPAPRFQRTSAASPRICSVCTVAVPTLDSVTTNFDGKDVPISGTHPLGSDTTAVTRVDANTRTAIEKKTGKTLYTVRGTVSKDSKVLTMTLKRMNGEGQPISGMTLVWDKQ